MAMIGSPEPSGHRDGVFGLWEREGRVLLVQNDRMVAGRRVGLWDLPGGSVCPPEGLRAALAREWREEVGLESTVGDLLLVSDGAKRHRAGASPLYTWRAFVFRVASEGEPAPGDGITAVRWVERDEATDVLDAAYHAPLRRWLRDPTGPRHDEVDWIDPVAGDEPEESDDADGLRRLLVVAALAAAGRTDLLGAAVEAARAAGCEPQRIEETLLQVVPYAGFPRTIAAFAVARPLLGPPSEATPGAPCATGAETFEAVYGDTAERVRRGLAGLHPELRTWTHAFAYGRVLARDGLVLAERELLAVSILTALGGLDDPLLGHMRAAVRLGATPGDVEAAVRAVPHVLGEARRRAALALLPRLRTRG